MHSFAFLSGLLLALLHRSSSRRLIPRLREALLHDVRVSHAVSALGPDQAA